MKGTVYLLSALWALLVSVFLPHQAAGQINITSVALSNGMIHLEWNGGTAPWQVEAQADIASSNWTAIATAATANASVPANTDLQFLRVASTPAPDTTARYRMTFVNTWSTTNPAGYTFPGSAHYTTFAGATHNDSLSMWKTGDLATPGMEQLAELGGTFMAQNEITAAITAGSADQSLSFPGFFPPGVNQVVFEFDVNLSHSKVSFASMVAPSPDWFVGVSAVDLLASGDWADTLTLPATVYDAGTETGAGFSLGNPAESPHKPITVYAPFTLPFGAFTFERIAP